ncbi:MAG: HD domain-containing protein [Planctomycetota bacterium]
MNRSPVGQRPRQLDRFVHELVVAILNLGMHAPSSQIVGESLRDLVATLHDITDADSPLRLVVQGGSLHACGHELIAASLQAGVLLDLCARRGIRALTFHPQVDAAEVGRFLETLLDEHTRAAFRRGARARVDRLLAGRGVRHVQVELVTGSAGAAAGVTTAHGLRDYRELTSFLHDNHVAAFRGEDLEIERATGVVEQAISQMQAEPSNLLTLASYDDIDSFTVGHSVRVALLALHVARAAGADKGDLVAIGTAALLHDVGKSRIPQPILFKRGRLDEEEWHIMAQHPRLGAEILVEQRHLDPRAIGAAFCHHMGPNRRGYPAPALWFEPSGVSKLVRVCDVFEALTAVRPYKKALTPLQAYAILFQNADDFDPAWLRFFARTIGLYPLGTRVLLDSGEQACVVRHGAHPQRPFVRVVHDAGSTDGDVLEIGAPCDGRPLQIAAVLGTGAGREEIQTVLDGMQCGPNLHAGHRHG